MMREPRQQMNAGRQRRRLLAGGGAVVATLAVITAVIVGLKFGGGGGGGAPGPREANGHNDRAGGAAATATTGRRLSAEDLERIRAGLTAASEYINSDRLGEAETILADLVKQFPNDEATLAQYSEVLLHQNKLEQAYAVTRDLIVKHDDQAEYRFNAGLMANMLGRLDESVVHFQEAARLDPANPQYPLYLAQILIKTHDLTEAEIRLLQAIKLDPALHEAYGTLGEIYYNQNKLELANQQVKRARKLAPDFFKWKLLEARLLRRSNQPQDAITLLSALPPREASLQPVIDEIAQCWAMMGSPRKAAEVHIEHLNQNPRSLSSAVDAGKYLIIAGDRQGARQWLGFAQRLDADAEIVKQLAAQLEG